MSTQISLNLQASPEFLVCHEHQRVQLTNSSDFRIIHAVQNPEKLSDQVNAPENQKSFRTRLWEIILGHRSHTICAQHLELWLKKFSLVY